jgi:hypothetical protein
MRGGVGESCGVVGEVGLKGMIWRGSLAGVYGFSFEEGLKTENGREMLRRVMCLIIGYRAELWANIGIAATVALSELRKCCKVATVFFSAPAF